MPSMQVRFIYINNDNLNDVPIVNGQIIALTDQSGYYYDMDGTRYKVSSEEFNPASVPFAVTTATSTTTAFACDSADIEELVPGTCIYVINSRPSASAAFTLNVSSTGYKPVYCTDGSRATVFNRHEGALFVYSTARTPSGSWDMLNDTIYTLEGFGQTSAVCTTESEIAAKVATTRIREFTGEAGAIITVKFTNAVTSDSTLNINSSGSYPITYKGGTLKGDEIQSNSTAVFMFNGDAYMLLGVDTLIQDVRALQATMQTPGIYWAEYGVTTFNELVDAMNAKLLIVMRYNGRTFIMSDSARGAFVFVPMVESDSYPIYQCKVSGWTEAEIELATKAEVDAKYTKPDDGIPISDLAFDPAAVDNTFLLADHAAGSVITGDRIWQTEEIARLSSFTDIYRQLTPSDIYELDVEPTTGMELSDSPYAIQYVITPNTAMSTDLLFTFGDPDYEWAAWASQEMYPGSGITHPAGVAGWTSSNIPLLVKYEYGDYYAVLTFRRKDGELLDAQYVASQISIRCAADRSDTSTSCTTVRNNTLLSDQLVALAQTYYNGRNDRRPDSTRTMVSGDRTILDTRSDTNEIDSAAFVGLVLRGLAYTHTGYYTYNYVDPSELVANPSYNWSINPAYYTNRRYSYNAYDTAVRTAGQLAKMFTDWGRVVPRDDKLASLEPGDIIFYALKDERGEWLEPSSYKCINHVAICMSKEPGSSIIGWDSERFPYRHTVLYVSPIGDAEAESRDGCFCQLAAEADWDQTPDYTGVNYHTIQLIVRPDLGTMVTAVPRSTKILPPDPFSTGEPGQIMFDSTTLYICVDTNVWKKVSLTSI